MHQIDAVIEDVAPFARGEGGAGELAVDGVEEGHDPGREAPAKIAAQEQPEGHDHEDRANSVTMLGVTPQRRQERVAWKAGTGQTCLVTMSVAPL